LGCFGAMGKCSHLNRPASTSNRARIC